MIHSIFGSNIDLHSGGMDLEFPHHENEIAQSEALYKKSPWCPFFSHTGHLYVNKEKMSKSLGNFVTVQDFLSQYEAKHFRILCLTTPYREIMEYSTERLERAAKKCIEIEDLFKNLSHHTESSIGNAANPLTDDDLSLMQQYYFIFFYQPYSVL